MLPWHCWRVRTVSVEAFWTLQTLAQLPGRHRLLECTLSVSVSDAPFVFLNALYIKRSTDCGANKTSDPTSINALVLISFATSAALLGSDFAVALCDLMLEAVPKLSCMQVQGHAADKAEGIGRPRNSSQSSTEGARGHAASGAFNR